MNKSKIEIEFDLQKLVQACVRRWWIIVASALAGAMIMWIFAANFITPKYSADVTIYVNNVREDKTVEYVSNSNLLTSQMLVNTYINVIKSKTVRNAIAEESGLDISPDTLLSIMRMEQLDETELFKVTVTHPDAFVATTIANAVAEVAPEEIENIIEGCSTKILDFAEVPEAPSSPNIGNNTVIGAFLGIVLAVIYIAICFFLDVRIKSEEDLLMMFDYPVLAQIPSFSSSRNKTNYVNKYYEYGSQNRGEAE